jgi:hypothetical protein
MPAKGSASPQEDSRKIAWGAGSATQVGITKAESIEGGNTVVRYTLRPASREPPQSVDLQTQRHSTAPPQQPLVGGNIREKMLQLIRSV